MSASPSPSSSSPPDPLNSDPFQYFSHLLSSTPSSAITPHSFDNSLTSLRNTHAALTKEIKILVEETSATNASTNDASTPSPSLSPSSLSSLSHITSSLSPLLPHLLFLYHSLKTCHSAIDDPRRQFDDNLIIKKNILSAMEMTRAAAKFTAEMGKVKGAMSDFNNNNNNKGNDINLEDIPRYCSIISSLIDTYRSSSLHLIPHFSFDFSSILSFHHSLKVRVKKELHEAFEMNNNIHSININNQSNNNNNNNNNILSKQFHCDDIIFLCLQCSLSLQTKTLPLSSEPKDTSPSPYEYSHLIDDFHASSIHHIALLVNSLSDISNDLGGKISTFRPKIWDKIDQLCEMIVNTMIQMEYFERIMRMERRGERIHGGDSGRGMGRENNEEIYRRQRREIRGEEGNTKVNDNPKGDPSSPSYPYTSSPFYSKSSPSLLLRTLSHIHSLLSSLFLSWYTSPSQHLVKHIITNEYPRMMILMTSTLKRMERVMEKARGTGGDEWEMEEEDFSFYHDIHDQYEDHHNDHGDGNINGRSLSPSEWSAFSSFLLPFHRLFEEKTSAKLYDPMQIMFNQNQNPNQNHKGEKSSLLSTSSLSPIPTKMEMLSFISACVECINSVSMPHIENKNQHNDISSSSSSASSSITLYDDLQRSIINIIHEALESFRTNIMALISPHTPLSIDIRLLSSTHDISTSSPSSSSSLSSSTWLRRIRDVFRLIDLFIFEFSTEGIRKKIPEFTFHHDGMKMIKNLWKPFRRGGNHIIEMVFNATNMAMAQQISSFMNGEMKSLRHENHTVISSKFLSECEFLLKSTMTVIIPQFFSDLTTATLPSTQYIWRESITNYQSILLSNVYKMSAPVWISLIEVSEGNYNTNNVSAMMTPSMSAHSLRSQWQQWSAIVNNTQISSSSSSSHLSHPSLKPSSSSSSPSSDLFTSSALKLIDWKQLEDIISLSSSSYSSSPSSPSSPLLLFSTLLSSLSTPHEYRSSFLTLLLLIKMIRIAHHQCHKSNEKHCKGKCPPLYIPMVCLIGNIPGSGSGSGSGLSNDLTSVWSYPEKCPSLTDWLYHVAHYEYSLGNIETLSSSPSVPSPFPRLFSLIMQFESLVTVPPSIVWKDFMTPTFSAIADVVIIQQKWKEKIASNKKGSNTSGTITK